MLTTGYWFLEPSKTPLPEPVEQFLHAGPPPVFIGFGSMLGRDPARTTTVVRDAARRAGLRLIVGTGGGGLTTIASDDVLAVDDIDHQLLFPRVAAVVHHGGAGTTATAFAAGRPQVVCPFVADQPFWARLAHQHGTAPPPLPQTRLGTTGLAAALTTAVNDPNLARNAHQLGERVRAENGVAAAVEALDHIQRRSA